MKTPYISVGIDVAADFSFVCIMTPSFELIGKPFKVVHTDLDSMNRLVSSIKKAEVQLQTESQIFLESTGIFHFPLFCFLRDSGFVVNVLNPLITHSTKNADIRKVKNDKFDAVKIAKLGLNPKIKKSVIPEDFVLNLRMLCREYYSLADDRTALINKLSNLIRMAFPAYVGIFSDIAGDASLAVLRYAQSLEQLLAAPVDEVTDLIARSARKGKPYAVAKYNDIINAAQISQKLTPGFSDAFLLIHTLIKHIALIDEQMDFILIRVKDIVKANDDRLFVKHIHLLDTIPGVSFFSAVALMCEIGDFSAFNSPKQLFAYFGLDPSVNESGKFKGTNNHMSKRGSRIARRVLFTIALASVRNKPNGLSMNPVLQAYYQEKVKSKLKKVALGAVMHKVCNIIFAILRDNSPFVLRSPDEHLRLHSSSSVAA